MKKNKDVQTIKASSNNAPFALFSRRSRGLRRCLLSKRLRIVRENGWAIMGRGYKLIKIIIRCITI